MKYVRENKISLISVIPLSMALISTSAIASPIPQHLTNNLISPYAQIKTIEQNYPAGTYFNSGLDFNSATLFSNTSNNLFRIGRDYYSLAIKPLCRNAYVYQTNTYVCPLKGGAFGLAFTFPELNLNNSPFGYTTIVKNKRYISNIDGSNIPMNIRFLTLKNITTENNVNNTNSFLQDLFNVHVIYEKGPEAPGINKGDTVAQYNVQMLHLIIPTINIRTCNLVLPLNGNVQLPIATVSNLSKPGSIANKTPFLVKFTCTSKMPSSTVFFTTTRGIANDGVIFNNGTASNVSLKIFNAKTDKPLTLSDSEKFSFENEISPEIPLSVAYYSQYGNAKPGTVSSNITYHINYN